jgi:hypothetical protein
VVQVIIKMENLLKTLTFKENNKRIQIARKLSVFFSFYQNLAIFLPFVVKNCCKTLKIETLKP